MISKWTINIKSIAYIESSSYSLSQEVDFNVIPRSQEYKFELFELLKSQIECKMIFKTRQWQCQRGTLQTERKDSKCHFQGAHVRNHDDQKNFSIRMRKDSS